MIRINLSTALVVALSAIVVTTAPGQASEAPPPAGAEKVREQPRGGGTHTLYRSTEAAGDVIRAYQATLQSDGWTIVSSGGGGGSYGGGGGLTATKGAQYLVLSAGGPVGSTNIDLCVWPTRPADDDC